MTERILLGGQGDSSLCGTLEDILRKSKPKAIGIASAFVTVQGIKEFIHLSKHLRGSKCRLVAGIDYTITHPEALSMAKKIGWDVRIGQSNYGIFHPKLIVAGQNFNKRGLITNPRCIFVGSSNMTFEGLRKNVECTLVADDSSYAEEAASVFSLIWRQSLKLTDNLLKNYSAAFAERNRARSFSELELHGIRDRGKSAVKKLSALKKEKPPASRAMRNDFAAVVWAELKSFTGGYAFQVEFPRSAGEVLSRFAKKKKLPNNKVAVMCEDGSIRDMTFRYYTDNSMFRLNVPNNVPGVQWARDHKKGIAVVRRGPEGGAALNLKILPPGTDMDEVVGRSLALSTWDKTQTRLYGWY